MSLLSFLFFCLQRDISAMLALQMSLGTHERPVRYSLQHFAKTFPLKYRMFCKSQFFARGMDCLSWEHKMPQASLRLLVLNFPWLLNAEVSVFVVTLFWKKRIPAESVD